MKFKRENSRFNLAFLDIMCCGFGAIVLLVILINGKTLQKRDDTLNDLKSELERATILKDYASNNFERLKNDFNRIETEEDHLKAQINKIKSVITRLAKEKNLSDRDARLLEEEIKAMSQKKVLLETLKKLRNEKNAINLSGANLIGFDGDGRRQYLTGLKLGGDRTLILVDMSASMLDKTIVNIIRRKLMPESIRKKSPKWLHVVSSLHWIISNLQPDKQFQVYCFNADARAVIKGTEKIWLNSNDSELLKRVITASQKLAPQGGTNLQNAFNVIRQMKPKPDSVLLLTDGLPTQGKYMQVKGSVTADERQELFDIAVNSIPGGVPINTLLFPIEGDPGAAKSFWGLAVDTNGSFITPSRDWP